MESFDVFVEQSGVMIVDRAHAVGGIQRRNNHHDGKGQEGDQHFGTNFQVCKQTHGGIPSLMRQPASSQKVRGVARSLTSKLWQQTLRDLSVQAAEESTIRWGTFPRSAASTGAAFLWWFCAPLRKTVTLIDKKENRLS
jgi:hypothetical protein